MRESPKSAPEAAVDAEVVLFAAFALNHAACDEGPIEMRLGERCILQWCASCAVMRVHVSPVEEACAVRV